MNRIIGCAPLTVTPQDCSGAPSNLIFYDFGVGGNPRPPGNFTFDRPGRYQVRQIINTGGQGGAISAEQTVEVLEPVNPTFTLEACNSRQVRLVIAPNNFPDFQIDFGDGNTRLAKASEPVIYQYPDETPRTITVRGYFAQAQVACGNATQTFTPAQGAARGVLQQVRVGPNGRPEVTFSLPPSGGHQLIQETPAANTTRTFDLPAGATSFTSPDEATVFDRRIFRLAVRNPCASTPQVGFERLGTFNLTLGPSRDRNRLLWNSPPHGGFQSYTLYRNNQVVFTSNNPNDLSYEDPNLECNTRYCYRLEVAFANNLRSITQEQCATTGSLSDPQPVRNLLANIANGQVQLNWQAPLPGPSGRRPNIARTIVERKVDTLAPTRTPVPGNPLIYNDNQVDVSEFRYCYKVFYEDACGNQAQPSNEYCTILLRNRSTPDSVKFTWDPLPGQGATAVIELLDEQGNVIRTLPATGPNSFEDTKLNIPVQLVNYRLRVTVNQPGQGLITLYSNPVRIRLFARFILPNAFSPNADGLNDTFGVRGQFITSFRIQIFNRWGELIYFSEDLNARWNGEFNGKMVPAGEYAYVITGQDTQGRAITNKGILTVVK
ncbi:MAG: gliding motility-associated C-terminal domain-containing protein [Bernardetiaceae bacterium]|nr:gliding motility-associated C-terminal domain-containing protein [Bernardetiaceae bacterium]